MKLDDLQELVDFMKKNGVAELDYAEKNNSVHLRLAPPAPPVPPCPPEGAGGPNVTAEDVKNAATKAAAAFSDSVKASAAAAAEFIKTKRDEYAAAGEEPVDADVEEPAEEPEAAEAEAPAEEPAGAEEAAAPDVEEPESEPETGDDEAEEEPEAEEAPAEEPEGEDEAEEEADDGEKVRLNTGAVRSAAKKAGEAVANTAKAGVSLGKLGLTRGRDALSALLPQRDEAGEEAAEEEPAPDEAPADEEDKTEE